MPSRRAFLGSSLCAGVSLLTLSPGRIARAADTPLDARLVRDVPAKLFDGKACYAHPRAGIVPGAGKDGKPRVVMTMNTVDLEGSDVFRAMLVLSTDDLGKTWTEPRAIESLGTRYETIDGVKRPVALSDFWPRWHGGSQTLLGTGHTVVYTPQWKVTMPRPRHTAYSTYDAKTGEWAPWRKLAMPDQPKFHNCGAGCTQRSDRADGTILLPFTLKPAETNARVAVKVCTLEKGELRYVEHGDELGVNDKTRGVGEPSLTRFQDRYFLTIRHDERGYVTHSRDGLRFEPLKAWTFDDGSDLGNYNTQQHWVSHSDGLFLVYTRRGANNDHVFRNRAPLFMAEVDPDKLCVKRATERILIPERGARLGNFGVTEVSPDETWVTESEWMQPKGVEKRGSDGSVYVVRLHWNKPNRHVS